MRHAYMIMAYNNFRTLKVLLQSLDYPKNDLYLHIDKKAKDFDPAEFGGVCKFATLTYVSRSYVNWGGHSLVNITMRLLRTAAQTKHLYYHLLSGADMPLVSNEECHTFLEAHVGAEFISFWNFAQPNLEQKFLDRMRYHYILRESFLPRCSFLAKVNIKNILLHRKNPWSNTVRNVDAVLTIPLQKMLRVDRLKNSALTFRKGSQWFSITHAFASYLLAHEKEIEHMTRNTSCADECFVQTMAYNSPFRDRVYDLSPSLYGTRSSLREIDWDQNASQSPRNFVLADYDLLIGSGMLFARKFDEKTDFEIIQRLYEHVTREHVPGV